MTPNNSRKNPNPFENVRNGGDRTILKIRLIFFENLEYGIKINQKHEMEMGNMGSISSKYEMETW